MRPHPPHPPGSATVCRLSNWWCKYEQSILILILLCNNVEHLRLERYVWWREIGEVENEYTSHNYFSLFGIFLPKIIKIDTRLIKFWLKQFYTVFETRCLLFVCCRSSTCETASVTTLQHPIVTVDYRKWLTRQVSLTSLRITTYVVPPLALVTNSLSLITFARMYRAKQQVGLINNRMHSLDGWHYECVGMTLIIPIPPFQWNYCNSNFHPFLVQNLISVPFLRHPVLFHSHCQQWPKRL